MLRTVLFSLTIIVLCEYVRTDSDTGIDRTYTRVKRGKYYSGPPQRFYNKPPINFPVRGAFSYTPPPFQADDGPHYPGARPYKVSKRPTNDGLGDEEINNLIKHLTKHDLDKIIKFSYEKENNVDNYEYSRLPIRGYDNSVYKEAFDTKLPYQDPSLPKPNEVEFNIYANYATDATPPKTYSSEDLKGVSYVHLNTEESRYSSQTYARPSVNSAAKPHEVELKKYINYVTDATPPKTYAWEDLRGFANVNLNTEESVHSSEAYSKPNVNSANQIPETENTYYVESNEEERLPKPVNMRDDFEVSYTNNVPTVVKADSSSYKVEDFGNLPLMNYYDSKLHSVSSYHVPHYTVTQGKQQGPPLSSSSSSSSPGAASIRVPPLEPAPPASVAKEQSDAHLKATKIWSHKSKGTAYTLHNDGTLTLERPGWPKYG